MVQRIGVWTMVGFGLGLALGGCPAASEAGGTNYGVFAVAGAEVDNYEGLDDADASASYELDGPNGYENYYAIASVNGAQLGASIRHLGTVTAPFEAVSRATIEDRITFDPPPDVPVTITISMRLFPTAAADAGSANASAILGLDAGGETCQGGREVDSIAGPASRVECFPSNGSATQTSATLVLTPEQLANNEYGVDLYAIAEARLVNEGLMSDGTALVSAEMPTLAPRGGTPPVPGPIYLTITPELPHHFNGTSTYFEVPEPGGPLLLLTGAGTLVALGRRRRRRLLGAAAAPAEDDTMERHLIRRGLALAAVVLSGSVPTWAATAKCPVDSVRVGTACVDRFEASVWLVPDAATRNKGLVKKIQKGKATAAALEAAGAVRLGCDTPAYAHQLFPAEFPPNGNWTPVAGSNPPTPGVYATSLTGVLPTACITWFQAAQACALSGKRLLTNEEWQRAAAGTPDLGAAPGPNSCNTASPGPAPTGNLAECASSWGARDMVGNVWEWVADWADDNEGACGSYLGDVSCFGGNGSTSLPGALRRGGDFASNDGAGPFAISSVHDPSASDPAFGFRCAR